MSSGFDTALVRVGLSAGTASGTCGISPSFSSLSCLSPALKQPQLPGKPFVSPPAPSYVFPRLCHPVVLGSTGPGRDIGKCPERAPLKQPGPAGDGFVPQGDSTEPRLRGEAFLLIPPNFPTPAAALQRGPGPVRGAFHTEGSRQLFFIESSSAGRTLH